MKKFVILTIVVQTLIVSSTGLKCYVCSKSGSDPSDECVTSPVAGSGFATVDCGSKYCTIKRQEYKNPSGKVASFYRGCENNPVYLNTMIEDTDFKTYFRACTSDLCNTGNGIQLVTGPGQGGSGLVLRVPGVGNGGAVLKSAVTLLVIGVLMNFYLGLRQ